MNQTFSEWYGFNVNVFIATFNALIRLHNLISILSTPLNKKKKNDLLLFSERQLIKEHTQYVVILAAAIVL